MNFEFIKDAEILKVIYPSCQNAELLAKGMPQASIFSARNSAECIAKLIYGITHSDEFRSLTFLDLLNDPKVRDFFGNNRRVINAFHFVRQTGNSAVHGTDTFSPDQALSVLRQLHFIVEATAMGLGLNVDCPVFDTNTPVIHVEGEDAEAEHQKKLQEIQAEHECAMQALKKQNDEKIKKALRRRDYEEMIKDRKPFDFSNRAHWDIFAKSYVDMHEYIEFKKQPRLKTTREYLSKYLYYMASVVSERMDPKGEKAQGFDDYMGAASIVVICDGKEYRFHKEHVYMGDITDEMIDAVNALENASSFSIDFRIYGSLRIFYRNYASPDEDCNDLIDENAPFLGYGMMEYLDSIRRREDFSYRAIIVYPTHDYEISAYCIEGGKSYDAFETGAADIVNHTADHHWTGSNVVLVVNFDFASHPEIVEKLHQVVLDFIPPNEVEATHDIWNEEEFGVLLNGCNFENADLHALQEFLEKINDILAPIAHTCTFDTKQGWYDLDGFGVAYIKCNDQKLTVAGTIFG